MNSDFQLLLRFWLVAILISSAIGIKIQLFRNFNYTDLILESSSIDQCNNFPGNDFDEVHSFTLDTCLIKYWHSDCKSTRTSKHMPGNYSTTVGRYYPFASYHECNEDEGGSQLNVDITKYYEKDKPTDVPAVLERYRQVCSCVNIPDYVQKMDKYSIKNHHNDFLAYYKPDCLGNSVRFVAGQFDSTRNISDWTSSGFVTKSQYHILSIGPDKNSTYYKSSCQNLLAQLTSKASILQQSLGQAELKVTANQRNIGYIQTARRNEAVELIRQSEAMERKFHDIERSIESKHTKIIGDFAETRRGVEMKLDDTEKKINRKLEQLKGENTDKFGEVEGELDHVEKRMEARHENLKHEFEKLKNDLRRLFL